MASIPVDPLTILLKMHDQWGPMRLAELSRRTKEAWLRSMFQGTTASGTTLNRFLEVENQGLRERLAALEREKAALSQRERELTEKIRRVQNDYEALKTDSLTYLQLREEHDSAKSALAMAQDSAQALARENESLKLSQRIRWIAGGVLVLFLGWASGMLMARRKKKRPQNYHV